MCIKLEAWVKVGILAILAHASLSKNKVKSIGERMPS